MVDHDSELAHLSLCCCFRGNHTHPNPDPKSTKCCKCLSRGAGAALDAGTAPLLPFAKYSLFWKKASPTVFTPADTTALHADSLLQTSSGLHHKKVGAKGHDICFPHPVF